MIQTLEIVNSYGEKLPIDLRNPEVSGYAIAGINGLGPVDVDIKQTQMVSGLKYKYNKGFHKYRDITIQFIFYEWNNSNFSIDKLRRDLVYFLQTNELITLYFVKDNGDVRKIQGYVSRHDAAYFSNACGAQVTVTCPDPWFIKVIRDESHEDKYYMLLSQLSDDSMTVSFEAREGYDEDLTEVIIKGNNSSQDHVYSESFDYEGSIVTGMRIEFQKNVIYTPGENYNITSEHYKFGKTGEMLLEEPNNYDAVSGKLKVDTGYDYISAVVEGDDESDNVIGWIDYNSITKRNDLPVLYQGRNTVKIKTDAAYLSSQNVAKVYFRTLYREV